MVRESQDTPTFADCLRAIGEALEFQPNQEALPNISDWTELASPSAAGLHQRLEQEGDLQFWNVLTDEYFKGESLPGSRRVPLDTVEQEVSRLSAPKDAEIVVYCAGPSCPASSQAAQKLTDLGYTNVKAYEGGIEKWKAEGRDVSELRALWDKFLQADARGRFGEARQALDEAIALLERTETASPPPAQKE